MSLSPLLASYDQAKAHMDTERMNVRKAWDSTVRLLAFHALAWAQAATTRILVGAMLAAGRGIYDRAEDETPETVN